MSQGGQCTGGTALPVPGVGSPVGKPAIGHGVIKLSAPNVSHLALLFVFDTLALPSTGLTSFVTYFVTFLLHYFGSQESPGMLA